MNREQLAARVAARTGLKVVGARRAVEVVFQTISEALARGERLQIVGFGSFGVRRRAARNGVNPRTKEKILIRAKKVAYFTPGKKLSDRVNRGK